MAQNIAMKCNNSITKTRNTILRMKNRSPKFKDVLRQKCKERIQQDRFKLLDKFRRIQLNNDFQDDLLSVIAEEWEGSEYSMGVEGVKPLTDLHVPNQENLSAGEDTITEHEQWLLQEYISSLLDEDSDRTVIICPLCRIGKFQTENSFGVKCTNCKKSFLTCKSFAEIHRDIFDTLSGHNRQCDFDPGFAIFFDSNVKENLCVVCNNCFFLSTVL